MSNDREKALDVALAAIDKQFGKGSIMRMGEKGSMAISAIPTGAMVGRLAVLGALTMANVHGSFLAAPSSPSRRSCPWFGRLTTP